MASSTMETVAGSGDGSFLLRFGAGHECPVVVGRDARLALVQATAFVIASGLQVFGVTPVEEMR